MWQHACRLLKLPPSVAESLQWTYRLHLPNIRLFDGVSDLIASLVYADIPIAILTDGRSITQRLKVQSLSLTSFPLFVSEEYQSPKPSSHRFESISKLYPSHNILYIADNPSKDFYAPTQLGWSTIGVSWCPNPIHTAHDTSSLYYCQPTFWARSPHEALSIIFE